MNQNFQLRPRRASAEGAKILIHVFLHEVNFLYKIHFIGISLRIHETGARRVERKFFKFFNDKNQQYLIKRNILKTYPID